MLRCVLWAFAAAVQPKALLIADNLCLRQQLVVLQRRKPRPRLEDVDRRFWILACRWFSGWQTSLLVVKPETVLRWHRQGWRTYWRRRSRRTGRPGPRPIAPELRTLIPYGQNIGTAEAPSQGDRAYRSAELRRRVAKRLPRLPRSPNRIAQNRSSGIEPLGVRSRRRLMVIAQGPTQSLPALNRLRLVADIRIT